MADHGISTLEGLASYTPETLRDIPQLGARRRAALIHALTALADSHAT
ncbi:hypothetical protein ACIBH1_44710 [Nonomuraea sp. NPDC050663]